MSERIVFRKHILSRGMNFLFLLPFILGFRPLLIRYNRLDFILYASGTVLLFVLIVISNRTPYVLFIKDRLILHLHYYQKPEIHPVERITLVENITRHSVKIHSMDFKPVRINMNPEDIKKLLKLLEEREIKIN